MTFQEKHKDIRKSCNEIIAAVEGNNDAKKVMGLLVRQLSDLTWQELFAMMAQDRDLKKFLKSFRPTKWFANIPVRDSFKAQCYFEAMNPQAAFTISMAELDGVV